MTDKNLSELITSSYVSSFNAGDVIDDTANTISTIWSAVKISNELNLIAVPPTDLTILANSSAIELQSSSGNNVTILSANSSTAGFLSAETQTIAGNKTFTDTITYNGTIDSDFIPELDITYDLGSANNRWRDLYLSGNTINLGDGQIKADEDTGTIALIPPITVNNPNPKAMILNSQGRMKKFDTTGGVLPPGLMSDAANTTDDTFESITVEQHVIANTFVGDGSSIINVDAITLQGNTVSDLQSYTDNTVDDITDFFTATVEGSNGVSDWAQSSNDEPFIATLTVNGIKDDDRPIVDIDLSNVNFTEVIDIQNSWQEVYRVEASSNNEIKLYALNEPEKQFDLMIKVVR